MKKIFLMLCAAFLLGACGNSDNQNSEQMANKNQTKKNIGSKLALYPTPAVVIGVEVGGKMNFMIAAHVGIIGHDRIMVSLMKSHHTNIGIREKRKFSVSMIDEAMLSQADYVGTVSGANIDKSNAFKYSLSDNGTPIIEISPLVMDCEVVDINETETFDNFICKIASTYAAESILDADGRIDYNKLKPVLFEMPTYQYLRTGEVIGKCKTIGVK